MRISSCKWTRLWAYLSSPAQMGFCWQSLGSPVRNGLAAGANWGCCRELLAKKLAHAESVAL